MTERIESAEKFARGWAFPYAYSLADRADLCEAITARDAAVRADERAKTLRECERTMSACQCWTINAARLRDVFVMAIRALPGFETTEEE